MGQFDNAAEGACGCNGAEVAVKPHCCCVVKDLMHVIGRKHALAVVNRIGRLSVRFSDLQRALDIGPSTLAETLLELEQVGLVHRRVWNDTPPRSDYRLTPAGEALRARLRPFLEAVRRLR